jgi:formylglycine-generating enzyme required for sulfatase activity
MRKFLTVLIPAFFVLVFNVSCGTSPAAEGGQAQAAVSDTSGIQPGATMSRTIGGMELKFRYVPAGTFQWDIAKTNTASITRGYWMAETETTQELFQAVTGYNPSYFKSAVAGEDGTPGKLPVENMTWYDAVEFCNKLSELDGKTPVYTIANRTPETGYPITSADVSEDITLEGYRLPTEFEWLWAAMGATSGGAGVAATGWDKTFSGSKDRGKAASDASNYAWYGFPPKTTHKVGTKWENELGLYDMSGNVWELCWNYYQRYVTRLSVDEWTISIPGERDITAHSAGEIDEYQNDWRNGAYTDYRGPEKGNPDNDYARAVRGGAYGSYHSWLWLSWRGVNYGSNWRNGYSIANMKDKIDPAVKETRGSETGFRVIYREAAFPAGPASPAEAVSPAEPAASAEEPASPAE